MTKITAQAEDRDGRGGNGSAFLPPLHQLRAFEAVGRAGSMRKAAILIGVSHTVVSRHVRNLEHWIGCKLLFAGPRGVTLTREGDFLLASVREAFTTIAVAAAALRTATRPAVLRIWAMPGFATRWLAPRLSLIEEALQGAEIILRAIDRLSDFETSEADVMIGFGYPAETPSGAVPLARPRMFPVASRGWIERHGAPDTLRALAAAPLIHEESRRQWNDWFEAAGWPLEAPLKGPRLWDANLGFDAAMSGQGIALVSRLTAGPELRNGALIELFQTDVRLGGYYLIAAQDGEARPLADRFAQWLRDAIADDDN